ncbi:hypothetical protein [Microbacterium forte]|uniref:hypothetical protein n=1 Tax=Microbacterium forte TaxID=2982533 RepID=UPI002893143D|nr:hypothetical protein [Microbacterium sp. A(2022)]
MAGVTPNNIRYPDGASKAKNLGPELQQMAEDIDRFIDEQLDPTGPLKDVVEDIVEDFVPGAVEDALDATVIRLVKCVHLEAGKWVWDGPAAPAATHYLIPDENAALVARATPFPTPSASAPELIW